MKQIIQPLEHLTLLDDYSKEGFGHSVSAKYSVKSVRHRKISQDWSSTSSPIKLNGIEFSPQKTRKFLPFQRVNLLRKGSTGMQIDLKHHNAHERNSSGFPECNMVKSISVSDETLGLGKLRILPDGLSSPIKTEHQSNNEGFSPFLKKGQNLDQTKLIMSPNKQKPQPFHLSPVKLENNELTDTISRKHPFSNCKLTESCTMQAEPTGPLKIEESVILDRSILQNFLILSKSQIKGNSYYQMIAIEKEVRIAVSLKCIDCCSIESISNQLKMIKSIGNDCPNIVRHFQGVVNRDEYVFIREYYETLLRDMLDEFDQDNIKELCKQMLTLFEYFTHIRLVYKGNFLTNLCYHGGLYKLRNFELCSVKKESSESSLRRRYLGVLREMVKALLGIDSDKPYYSRKLKRELRSQTIVFMTDLVKNGTGFKQLKEHPFFDQ